ncbi:class I SAM-dependent methyltransferase [Candidatus Pelagibacter ubique]|nr:class I SAM-dependent methyltransferase [Candidatus Pelagibacter ubique]
MKLIERKFCPLCFSKTKLKTLYCRSYNSQNLSNFINQYYTNSFLSKIVKKNNYEIIECLTCNFIYQKNIPSSKLSNFLYDKLIPVDESFKKKISMTSINFKVFLRDALLIEKMIKKDNYRTEILEFGSGWGIWARFMKTLNFKVTTLEISKKRVAHIKKNNLQNYNNIKKIKKKFDIIFSDQVIEHINNPYYDMLLLIKLLKKNGYMIHKFPSSFLFKNKIAKNYEVKKDCAHPLEHINIFTKKSMLILSKKLKLKIINPIYIKNIPLITKIVLIKNYFLFNTVILTKKN